MCPSSGELIVSIRHLVYVTLKTSDFFVILNYSHVFIVTYTRCHSDTINSPDDVHIAVRNMYRTDINIHDKEMCVKLVIYKDYVRTLHKVRKMKLCAPFDLRASCAFAYLFDIDVEDIKLKEEALSSLLFKFSFCTPH